MILLRSTILLIARMRRVLADIALPTLLGEIALAMQHHLTVSDMLAAIHTYPTLHTGLQQALFEAYLSSAKSHSTRAVVSAALRLRR